MRKTFLAIALTGTAASVAIITQSRLKDEPEAAASTDTAVATVRSVPQPQPAPVTAVPGERDTAVASDTPPKPARPYLRDVPNVVQNDTTEQSATGADVLRRASNAYAKVKTLRANFVQKRDNPILGSTTTTRGTLYQKRPDRFMMKFSEPAGDIIVSDGRYFWLYYPSADAKQVLRAPASADAAGGVDLQAQFLGDPLRRFTHTYHGTETVNGRKTYVITMVPKQNVGYKALKVWIDAQDALVRRFVLTENNGLVQEITLSNLAINPALSNDLFQFTPPANAKIIENPS
jgi:outer membrane lipoprotein carrier protein